MILATLFAIFAVLGLLVAVLDLAAKANSAAPSMYRSDAGGIGLAICIVCGLISGAAFISFLH